MLWIIEMLDDNEIIQVNADSIRMSQNGDMWFCDEKDKQGSNDYTPKFILAKGSYKTIARNSNSTGNAKPAVKQPTNKPSKQMKQTRTKQITQKVSWI